MKLPEAVSASVTSALGHKRSSTGCGRQVSYGPIGDIEQIAGHRPINSPRRQPECGQVSAHDGLPRKAAFFDGLAVVCFG